MPRSKDNLQTEIYDQLKSLDYDPVPMSSSGKEVPVPEDEDCDIIQFHFKLDGVDYGTATISFDGMRRLSIYTTDGIQDSPKTAANGEMSWPQLKRFLKEWAMKRGLGFEIKNSSNLKSDMQRREHTKLKEISESYWGTRKTSYNDSVPTVKMIIKHSKQLAETDARFRNIERIFVENQQGERILLPTTSPRVGRAFARHIAEGGYPNDERGRHISQIAEEYNKLGGFVRATRNRQFNESTGALVTEAQQQLVNLRESLTRLSSRRGYGKYFESWTPTLLEDDVDYAQLNELFTESHIDSRISEAMPLLARLSRNIQSTTINELAEFESWADDVSRIDEEELPTTRGDSKELARLLRKQLPVGADALNALGAIEDIIDDQKLYDQLKHLASKHDPDADARGPIIDWLNRHIDDPRFAKIIKQLDTDEDEDDESEEPAVKSGGGEEKPAAPATPPPQATPQGGPAGLGNDAIGNELAGLAGLAEAKARNPVAKNSKSSGSGRHKSAKDYSRKAKHRNRINETDVDEYIAPHGATTSPETVAGRIEETRDDSLLARIRKLSGL